MPRGNYGGVSLEKSVLEEAREYAQKEGFRSTSAFVTYLIKLYPEIKSRAEVHEDILRRIVREELHKGLQALQGRMGNFKLEG